MKERPILFSDPMVRAILSGQKTQTRRVCKPAEAAFLSYVVNCGDGFWGDEEGDNRFACPYGQPGERLWMREAHEAYEVGHVHYRADWPNTQLAEAKQAGIRWTPSIHMPRWACRLLLEIVSVRVERLHDISQDDAVAEGCDDTRDMKLEPGRIFHAGGPRDAFAALWSSINGAESWDANPWVWVIEFRRVAA